MSFVVEIPTFFTQHTQIPLRTGNTVLTGNETIRGDLQVNGSLTLNNSDISNTNILYLDSLDISNNLDVHGTVNINNLNVTGNIIVYDISVNHLEISGNLFMNNCIASGLNSAAMGDGTTASGENSVAMGLNTTASDSGMLAIGKYNDTSNALFVIGNGDSSNKSDALVVDNDGNTSIAGTLDVTGNTTLDGTLNANGGITCDTDKFVVEDSTGNSSIGGTLDVTGNTSIGGSLNVDTIQPNGTTGNIMIDLNSADDLNFIRLYDNDGNYSGISVARIDDDKIAQSLNFTGQHRCFIKDIPYTSISNEYVGRIVCADQNINISISGSIKKGNQAITQNETLPYVSLSTKNRDKSCFGVISASEDPNERVDRYGAFCTPFEKEKGDTRVYINSVGEGAIWVINKNGPLESGDYITTCDISGYGVKQDDDILHNYSVAKITMDCSFAPLYQPVSVILKDASDENILDAYGQIQWTNALDASGNIIYEYEYNIRYINEHGEETNEPSTYIAAYVGCTYHCG